MKKIAISLLLVIISIFTHAQTQADISNVRKISATQGGFMGKLDGDGFGYAEVIGDVDGDGVEDLALGEPWDDEGYENAGAVWILFMNNNRTVKAYEKISALSEGFSGLLSKDDNFGYDISAINDFNNDGVPDIAVGAWSDDDLGMNSGAVWLIFLNNNGSVKSYQKISATQGGLVGLTSQRQFGFGVTSLGDLDGDGVTDIAVGSPTYDNDGGLYRGCVWILFLNSDGTVKSQQKINDYQGGFNEILDDHDRFGLSLECIGDINNDGIVDLAVHSGQDDDGARNAGAFYILFLTPNGLVNGYQKISAKSGNFNGEVSEEVRFGHKIINLGDINGDGINDLLTSSYLSDDGGTDKGKAWILYLDNDGSVKYYQEINSLNENLSDKINEMDYFGCSLGVFNGFNANGKKELVIGSRNDDDGTTNAGAFYIIDLEVKHKPVAQAGKDLNICNKSQFTLDASASSVLDNDPLSFNWECTDLNFSSNEALINIDAPDVQQTTTYNFILTVSCQDIASDNDTIAITVYPDQSKPTISVSQNILTSTKAAYYQWYLNDEIIEDALGQTFIPEISGNYHVVVSNEMACNFEESNVIAINLTPVAVISGTTNICSGTSFKLNGRSSYIPNANNYSLEYNWSSNDIIIENTELEEITIIAPDSNETYKIQVKLQVTNNQFVSNIDSIEINIHPSPSKPEIFESGDTLYTNLASTYEWHFDGAIISSENKEYCIPTNNGLYTVFSQNEYGCISEESDSYLIEKVPIAIINGYSTVCSGSTIVLNANSSYISNQTNVDFTYEWSSNSITINNNTSEIMLVAPKVNSNTQIDFYLQVKHKNTTSQRDTFVVNIIQSPNTPIIAQFADTLLSTIDDSYQWYLNGVEINGATDSTFVIEHTGIYQVKTINKWGCVSDISVPESFIYTNINSNINSFKVYPNPTSDIINVVGLNPSNENTIIIYDETGRICKQSVLNNGNTLIDLKNLNPGYYFIELQKEKKTIKVIKK
ncbi:MAG: FG-GAP repeat protein [Marinilabiliaceae bacterium]|nr:FG-GAP repeat protein [Marinilabiliaceae bacterium]